MRLRGLTNCRKYKYGSAYSIVGLCLVILMTLTFPPNTNGPHEASPRDRCKFNEQDIRDAFNQSVFCLEDKNTVEMPISWRVSLLPYMNRSKLFQRYDSTKPWNSHFNSSISAIGAPGFRCPIAGISDRPFETSYVAVSGSPFGLQVNEWHLAGGFQPGKSQTAFIMETSTSRIHWMEPKDLPAPVKHADGSSFISGPHNGTRFIVFADGSVRQIRDDGLRAIYFQQQ